MPPPARGVYDQSKGDIHLLTDYQQHHAATSARQLPLRHSGDTVATSTADRRPEPRNLGASMSSHQLRRDAIREFVTQTRAEQGLPPTIEDPTALNRIAAIFRLVKDSKSDRDAV